MPKNRIDSISEDAIRNTLESAHLGQINDAREINVIVTPKRKKMEGDFIMVFQRFISMAAIRLTGSQMRVLAYLLGKSQFENFVDEDIKDIGKELKLPKGTILRALKVLKKESIIVVTKANGDRRRNEYFINPLSAWKGKAIARDIMIREFTKVAKPNQLPIPFQIAANMIVDKNTGNEIDIDTGEVIS